MLFIHSDVPLRRFCGAAFVTLGLVCAAPASGQVLSPVVSSDFSLSGAEAALQLELQGGRKLDFTIRRGVAYANGTAIGDAPRGSDLDRQWRDLLTRAMDATTEELPQLLFEWSADAGDVGARFENALDSALMPAGAELDAASPAAPIPNSDTVTKLVDRIQQLERQVEQSQQRVVIERPTRHRSPFRHISEGLAGIFSILVAYTVLFGIGFGVIFFGGRKYIEGVADTARHATGRSFLVGLAASFLVVPAFVLGIIALIISIVGIPGLLVWVPGFPVAFVLALLLGYLGVAHAVGESFAERRFYVTDWFQRGNSYYFLLSGIGILLALFLASQVVHMAGPWLRAINAILIFLGGMATLTAVMIGFGAVLISRGGKHPVRLDGAAERDLFTEDASV